MNQMTLCELKLTFEYRNRDGTVKNELRASKSHLMSFIPAVGWRISVEYGEDEVSTEVIEICWPTSFRDLSLIVHTRKLVYSDGDVDQSRLNHMQLLRDCGWGYK